MAYDDFYKDYPGGYIDHGTAYDPDHNEVGYIDSEDDLCITEGEYTRYSRYDD